VGGAKLYRVGGLHEVVLVAKYLCLEYSLEKYSYYDASLWVKNEDIITCSPE
jgi:hypothetical protein